MGACVKKAIEWHGVPDSKLSIYNAMMKASIGIKERDKRTWTKVAVFTNAYKVR